MASKQEKEKRREKAVKAFTTTSKVLKVILWLAGLAVGAVIIYAFVKAGVAVSDAFKEFFHIV